MITKSGSWINAPESSSPVNESNLIAVNNTTSISDYHDKLVPLICERCGGSINKETYTCDHYGTQYEWR